MNRQTRFFCNIFLSDKLRVLWFLKAVSAYFHDIVEVKSVRKPRFETSSQSLACLIRFFGGSRIMQFFSKLLCCYKLVTTASLFDCIVARCFSLLLFFFKDYCVNYELHRYLMSLIFFLFRPLVHANEFFTIYIELYAIARLIIF